MKKLLILILLFFLGIGGYFYYDKNISNNLDNIKKEINYKKEEKILVNSGLLEEKDNFDSRNEEFKKLKEELNLKGLIADGDAYSEEDNYMAAIITYQKALKEIPDDVELNIKIGDLYYEMKNFKKSSQYYNIVKKSKKLDKDKLIKSIINADGVKSTNINNLKSQINILDISDEKKYYYNTSMNCVVNYSKCRDEFKEYFKKETLNDKDLLNIKKAFDNFENFQSKDLYYKEAFISGAFYENSFYYLALQTSKQVLKKKLAYKPMLKVAAKSAYEIGRYDDAKNLLNQIRIMDDYDAEVSYFLGRIYEKLNDKMLAIVNYEKSLNDNYEDKASVYKRLIFIYFEKKNNRKMLENFDNLLKLEKEKLNETDFYLAIYYNILNKDLKKAKAHSRTAIKYYPNSEVFYGYFSWILLQKPNLSKTDFKIIELNIKKAEKINKKNPMIIMIKGIYYYKNKDYTNALVNLKIAYGMDKTSEYKDQIQLWLDKVKKAKKTFKK